LKKKKRKKQPTEVDYTAKRSCIAQNLSCSRARTPTGSDEVPFELVVQPLMAKVKGSVKVKCKKRKNSILSCGILRIKIDAMPILYCALNPKP